MFARPPGARTLENLEAEIIACRRCARLVTYREEVAARRPPRYREWGYWARPLPSFGDPQGRLLILGLAPAAHGGNRTGRMFTGDRSGEWLFSTLYRFGFADRPHSQRGDDGLALRDAYITATLHCCPPQNKPLPEEIRACRPYLLAELRLLRSARVLVALGRIAFEAALSALAEVHPFSLPTKPAFGHGRIVILPNHWTVIASYHPSQQNTLTGRLTSKMFDDVFAQARALVGREGS